MSQEYDIIFAGGGTCACLTAGRLAAADPSLKILVILPPSFLLLTTHPLHSQILEAGPHIRNVQDHVQPARYFRNLAEQKEVFTFHVGRPSEAIAGRSPVVPSAKCVGGGSGVNFLMYTRAAASDFDDWERLYGNPGWGSSDLIPLARKVENYPGDTLSETHGTGGPIDISTGNIAGDFGNQYLAVAAKYDSDRGFIDDPNDFKSCNGYGPWQKFINPVSGKRSDTAHHFIYNQEHNRNLVVLDRQRVVRVILDEGRAVGVEYADEGVDIREGTVRQVFASRLVVVSAGTFDPLMPVLNRSGIGATEILHKNDIPQVVDLPGVGENYNDHNCLFVPYYAEKSDSLDDIFHGDPATEVYAEQWNKDGTGLMAANGLDAGGKLRPSQKDLEILGPTFTKRWNDFFVNAPDKPVLWVGTLSAYVLLDPPRQPGRKFFSMAYYTEYPVSTGRVHIQAGLNPYAPLDFEAGYLDDPTDLATLRWGYKHGRELARRMEAYGGCFGPGHPRFPEGSEAAVDAEAQGPVAISAPDIKYTDEDDKAIDAHHRLNVQTTWHSLGTCAMKPRDQNGVVDVRLNVYGIQNLKVADMSIAPSNVSANTYNTALIIGEKAAVIIAEDLGIEGV
ncbi:related to alcohol oxidase [Armillaria ostoyae]|uniref:Related to alcohol oxidase n=1 Tax=Armillaria ostoyae TaxID=47428 RepID=A0A284RLS3_ARMOS|nr:related to alcohol oxidase [Armillaria ostoyae]